MKSLKAFIKESIEPWVEHARLIISSVNAKKIATDPSDIEKVLKNTLEKAQADLLLEWTIKFLNGTDNSRVFINTPESWQAEWEDKYEDELYRIADCIKRELNIRAVIVDLDIWY